MTSTRRDTPAHGHFSLLSSSWESRAQAPDDAVACIRSGTSVFVHGACATPQPLLEALCAREELRDVELYHLHTHGPAPFADPRHEGRFHSNSLFIGANLRTAVAEGRADFIPIFLSDIPWLFTSGKIRLDTALVQMSPPDRHGYCSLGPSVDAARAAVDSAAVVIAEINDRVPRTHGDSFVHISRVDRFIRTNRPLLYHEPTPVTDVDMAIGRQIADLIEDGSTLQLGIGAVPAAVLMQMTDKNDLGVHTEMFSDGVVDLVRAGVITNRRKTVHPGHIVTSFASGTQKLFDFIDDNPTVEFHPCDYTNDTALIRRHDRMVAVNSAIEIDLTGQICADSLGHRMFSGGGGQMDFMRGAALAAHGKPVIALPSTAADGKCSRIVPALRAGAGVVTTRAHVHWVVTEYGAVNLHGLTLRGRGEALVSIAHPDFRAELKRAMEEQRHFTVHAAK